MMRLNRAAALNLREGMRVQSDINGKPDEVLIVRSLFEQFGATDGLAALVVRYEDGKPVSPHTTAACWFWPEGVLEAIPDNRSHNAEKFALRAALLTVKNTAERLLAGLDS